jgi:hypothetical protein
MRKCLSPFLLAFSLVLVCSSSVSAQSWRQHRAQLCFVREENNGLINVLQSWIHVDDYEAAVIGGGAVCLYVAPGASELYISSTVPYEPNSRNREACKSKVLKLELKSDEDRTFMIEPKSVRGSRYACGWRVVPAATRK